ncbi:MAG: hypothetical protein AAGF79_03950 [Pseudomonadota bacterium]
MADSKKSQLDRFKEAARELGTDNDEDRFEERLKKIVKKPLTEESASDSVAQDGDDS